MFIGRFLERLTRTSRGLIESLDQLSARIQSLLLHLATICRSYVEFALCDLHSDPHRNRSTMFARYPKIIDFSCGFQSYLPSGASSKARRERSTSRSNSATKNSVSFISCLLI